MAAPGSCWCCCCCRTRRPGERLVQQAHRHSGTQLPVSRLLSMPCTHPACGSTHWHPSVPQLLPLSCIVASSGSQTTGSHHAHCPTPPRLAPACWCRVLFSAVQGRLVLKYNILCLAAISAQTVRGVAWHGVAWRGVGSPWGVGCRSQLNAGVLADPCCCPLPAAARLLQCVVLPVMSAGQWHWPCTRSHAHMPQF